MSRSILLGSGCSPDMWNEHLTAVMCTCPQNSRQPHSCVLVIEQFHSPISHYEKVQIQNLVLKLGLDLWYTNSLGVPVYMGSGGLKTFVCATFIYACACVPLGVCQGQRTTLRSLLSSFTLWVLET